MRYYVPPKKDLEGKKEQESERRGRVGPVSTEVKNQWYLIKRRRGISGRNRTAESTNIDDIPTSFREHGKSRAEVRPITRLTFPHMQIFKKGLKIHECKSY